MIYETIPKINKNDFELKVLNCTDEELVLLLYGLIEIDDWEYAQNIYLKYLQHIDYAVVESAIKCLGDLARVHRKLETDKVLKILDDLSQKEPNLKYVIEETIEDIYTYILKLKSTLLLKTSKEKIIELFKFLNLQYFTLEDFYTKNIDYHNLMYENYCIFDVIEGDFNHLVEIDIGASNSFDFYINTVLFCLENNLKIAIENKLIADEYLIISGSETFYKNINDNYTLGEIVHKNSIYDIIDLITPENMFEFSMYIDWIKKQDSLITQSQNELLENINTIGFLFTEFYIYYTKQFFHDIQLLRQNNINLYEIFFSKLDKYLKNFSKLTHYLKMDEINIEKEALLKPQTSS